MISLTHCWDPVWTIDRESRTTPHFHGCYLQGWLQVLIVKSQENPLMLTNLKSNHFETHPNCSSLQRPTLQWTVPYPHPNWGKDVTHAPVLSELHLSNQRQWWGTTIPLGKWLGKSQLGDTGLKYWGINIRLQNIFCLCHNHHRTIYSIIWWRTAVEPFSFWERILTEAELKEETRASTPEDMTTSQKYLELQPQRILNTSFQDHHKSAH